MARNPSSSDASAKPSKSEPGPDPRDKAIDALFSLLAEKPWGDIGLHDLAEQAGIGLADLRGLFPSKGAVLAGFVRKIDLDVLKHDVKDMADEPARERLFDVLMRRFEALAPYREGLRAARRGVMRDPLGAAEMNKVAVSSMQWMLAAAGVQESGPLGAARAQALVLVNARVFETFLNDSDQGLARTMKALDEELRKAERWAQRADGALRLTAPFRDVCDRAFGRKRRKDDVAEDVASAA
ncbi:AcrR family transcriptional regulator [Methylopila capsulata]|uniref:AcrR family transcriptional regulator n=1 Tax=Methylopila capsulata TaxID=61654 RepID=A0A9W6IUC1_9HYPH|nr:TetR/AcrR family transcriptional regulator [Methylopila capsulata]MBM7852142.1 AcrR family transcriptional regulator [Methylopila capsulata]GLK56348.1 hypothetical protein GCM10008170_23670 [Methylopila capsulata]